MLVRYFFRFRFTPSKIIRPLVNSSYPKPWVKTPRSCLYLPQKGSYGTKYISWRPIQNGCQHRVHPNSAHRPGGPLNKLVWVPEDPGVHGDPIWPMDYICFSFKQFLPCNCSYNVNSLCFSEIINLIEKHQIFL